MEKVENLSISIDIEQFNKIKNGLKEVIKPLNYNLMAGTCDEYSRNDFYCRNCSHNCHDWFPKHFTKVIFRTKGTKEKITMDVEAIDIEKNDLIINIK